ncbi:MAG: hypothetical protein IKN04_21890, partial [Clostridia bacterium]|nr:hypothetical protein [Clostridia bacterium]
MKKMIALLALLCVTVMPFAVMAENVITWDDVSAVIEASGLEGGFYAMEELGLAIWLPDGLNAVELSEEEIAEGYLYVLTDDEETCLITVD